MISASPVVLACGADEAFAMALAVTLFSAISHLTRPAEVYIIDGGLGDRTRDRLQEALGRARGDTRVTFLTPPLDFLRRGTLPLGGLSPMAYLRLLLPA